MNVKELIDLGCVVEMPYKKHLMDWFGEPIKLSKFENRYWVFCPSRVLTFDSFDKALSEFRKFEHNVGMLQLRVAEEHPEWDDVVCFEAEYIREIAKKQKELGIYAG